VCTLSLAGRNRVVQVAGPPVTGCPRSAAERPSGAEYIVVPTAAVASDEPRCSAVGSAVLAENGTAVDAAIATALSVAIAFTVFERATGLPTLTLARSLARPAGAALAMAALAQRQIKGMTGDIAGATQQVAEILFFAVLASQFGSI
jgi:cobalamin synthase